MSSLSGLYASDNRLGYALPAAMGGMTSLRHLDLSRNAIQGTIPDNALGGLEELNTLDLSWNLLFGSLPRELYRLRKLIALDLGHNNLGEPFVAELGDVSYLSILRLNDNHFSGEVPTNIGALVHLEELR